MLFGDRGLDYAFDPLKVVDVKTLTAIADSLKKSNDRGKRAVGVFLDRVNRLRIADTEQAEGGSSSPAASARSDSLRSSGLRDLRD
jgi:hypothetical protein